MTSREYDAKTAVTVVLNMAAACISGAPSAVVGAMLDETINDIIPRPTCSLPQIISFNWILV